MITELKIIQPFFVLSSNVYLKRYAPGSVISHFYKFKCTVPSGRPVMVVPDGSTDIIFECDPERPSAEICGTVNKSTPDIFRQGKHISASVFYREVFCSFTTFLQRTWLIKDTGSLFFYMTVPV